MVRRNGQANHDKGEVKALSTGREVEILERVAGIPPERLDGKHHSCPKCGGKDRFRCLVEKDAGVVYCNQCFRGNNGDVFAAVQHFQGVPFPEAVAMVGEYLGAKPRRSRPGKGGGGRQTSKPEKATPSPTRKEGGATPSKPSKASPEPPQGNTSKPEKGTSDGPKLKKGERLAATYEYQGEKRGVLYQVLRIEGGRDGKRFLQRKPGGSPDEWVYKVKDVTPVPYKLPELLKTPLQTIIYMPEGEKDVDRLRSAGLAATCNAGGAQKGKWEDWKDYFKGRHLALLPDNDGAGEEHVKKICNELEEVAASIRIVDLPELPDKGDVSDWLDAGGTLEELQAITQKAEPFTSEKPFTPFPVESLPLGVREFVEEGARAIDCDPSFLAVPALAVLGAAIGNSRTIELKSSWQEPAVIWAAIVARSGTRKSPALDLATEPLEEMQAKWVYEHDLKYGLYEDDLAKYQQDLKKWERGKLSEKPKEPTEPTQNRCILKDVTTESMIEKLAENPRGLLVSVDELSGWFGSFDAYSSKNGKDAPIWLQVFGARRLTSDRKTGKKMITVPLAFCGVVGGIQPAILRKAANGSGDNENLENGLLSRLLFCSPPIRPKRWSEDVIHEETQERYHAIVEDLLQIPLEENIRGEPKPVSIPLDPHARSSWITFYDQHAFKQAEAGDTYAASLSKLEAYAARLALVCHLARAVQGEASEAAIDRESILSGIELAKWFAKESARVLLKMSVIEEKETKHVDLLEVLQGLEEITPRNLMQKRRRTFHKSCDAEEYLSNLCMQEVLVREVVKPRTGRPKTIYRWKRPGEDEEEGSSVEGCLH